MYIQLKKKRSSQKEEKNSKRQSWEEICWWIGRVGGKKMKGRYDHISLHME